MGRYTDTSPGLSESHSTDNAHLQTSFYWQWLREGIETLGHYSIVWNGRDFSFDRESQVTNLGNCRKYRRYSKACTVNYQISTFALEDLQDSLSFLLSFFRIEKVGSVCII